MSGPEAVTELVDVSSADSEPDCDVEVLDAAEGAASCSLSEEHAAAPAASSPVASTAAALTFRWVLMHLRYDPRSVTPG